MNAPRQTAGAGQPGPRRPARGPWWTRTRASLAQPGPFLQQTGAPAPSPRSSASGERRTRHRIGPCPGGQLPGIAPLPPAGSSPACPVSCRDASGLAVLMGTGRRAGLPGVSRPGAPAPPVARLSRITGAGRQIDIFSRCPGRHHRPGGWPAPRFRRSGRRRRHHALPALGKPGPQAGTPHTPSTPPAPADSARQHRLLQPAARAAGWPPARGPPVNSRCRGGLACRWC